VAALDPVRLGVLENLTFEMGVHGVAEFKQMLTALQQGDFAAAAAALLDSALAKTQAPSRAQRLALLLTSGQWQ
jgi:lysozyme